MRRYIKKSVAFRAARWTGAMTPDVQDLLDHRAEGIVRNEDIRVVAEYLKLGKSWSAGPGDWIVSTPDGLTATSDDLFRATFEEIDEASRVVLPTDEEHEAAGQAFTKKLDALLVEGLRLSSEVHAGIWRDRNSLLSLLRGLLDDQAYVAARHERHRIRNMIAKELTP